MAASTHCFYLGLKDEPVKSGSTTWQTNKIGGVPDWTTSALTSLPELVCPLCTKHLLLALQIYSPLDRCNWYHRTIYIFCCINPSCWNKQESWKVIRSQERSSPEEEGSSCSAAKPAMSADWLVGQDDWGDDSWDDESPHHMVHNSGAQNLEASLGSMTVTSPTVASVALLSNEEASGDTEMEEQTLVRAESLDSSRALENMCALRSSEGERKALLKDLQRVNSFKSFYIAVVEESTLPGETPADIRARKLMQDYEAGEGNVFRVPGKGQGNMTYAQEAYEKPQYSDTTFHRFNKRLRRCPQQLIRFCWEGEPLFISEPTSSWQPGTCESCGARRCFELQAMPALIQSLEVEAVTELQGPPVEFGTVLFYSCSASCWKDGDAWKSEVSLVQPDPDAAFWDKFG